jgi:hypothetical protein
MVNASDGRCSGTPSFQGFSLYLAVPDDTAADRLFAALADGGQVQMPLTKTFWSPLFGMVADRFGLDGQRGALRRSGVRVRLKDGGTDMKYMLLIYLDEQKPLSETERQDCYAQSTQLAQELHTTGKYLSANPLHPTSMATSVRVRDGKRLVTDGPFAETREQLGGYFLIDAKDLDEALDIAARIPMARKDTVEVRPVIEIPDLPTA